MLLIVCLKMITLALSLFTHIQKYHFIHLSIQLICFISVAQFDTVVSCQFLNLLLQLIVDNCCSHSLIVMCDISDLNCYCVSH